MKTPTPKERRENIIKSGYRAIEELIRVAEERIITDSEDDLTADKLKNAAATKKLSVFDAFDILERIEAEETRLKEDVDDKDHSSGKGGFAERRVRK